MAPSTAQDFRTASEQDLLEAVAARQPLALAEAYHRLVPAAHAVTRRLVSGSAEVEQVLLTVFEQLWASPPAAGPAEGWVRRTAWAAAAGRLRADNIAPASPSAAGLLPDLPAPDVRFLDAAERAIAELPDDERRALLLAHDKGVASTAQEPGAAEALGRALIGLAGPETSAADRSAMQEDDAEDVTGLGDWCLGVADGATAARVAAAIDERPGAAARSRAVRRGRRRIEGLPATPDMGQRVLVRVLTGSQVGMPAPTAPAADQPAADQPAADQPVPAGESTSVAPDPATDALADVDGAGAAAAPTVDGPLGPVADPLMDTADLPAAGGEGPAAGAAAAAEVETDGGAATGEQAASDELATSGERAAADPLAADGAAASVEPHAVEPGHEDWAPNPGDTAELRLSDILAEDSDEADDPFAELERDDPEPAPAPATASPYAALQDLSGEPDQQTAPAPFSVSAARLDPVGDADAHEVYIEGQEAEPATAAPARNPVAALLSWLLPILGGAAVGILIAVSVFGSPS